MSLRSHQSFATGRAPAINLADTDTKFPEYDGDGSLMPCKTFTLYFSYKFAHASMSSSDPYWKYRHAAACLWPTIKLAAAEAASYDETMSLDRKIRTFPVPTHLQVSLQGSEVWQWSTDAGQAVQQYCIVADKELSKLRRFSPTVWVAYGNIDLLFLHRNYVAVALRSENALAHKFGGSVLAAYRCATRMCFALRDLYRLHPKTVGGMWYFWSGIFSACVRLHHSRCRPLTYVDNADRFGGDPYHDAEQQPSPECADEFQGRL